MWIKVKLITELGSMMAMAQRPTEQKQAMRAAAGGTCVYEESRTERTVRIADGTRG